MVEKKSKQNAKLAEAGIKGLIYGCALGYELLDKGEYYYRLLSGPYMVFLANLAVGVGCLVSECMAAESAGAEASLEIVVQSASAIMTSIEMITLDWIIMAAGLGYALGNYKQDDYYEKKQNPFKEAYELVSD